MYTCISVSALTMDYSRILCPFPSHILNNVVDISPLIELYREDLPSPTLVDQELKRLEPRYMCMK